MLAFQEKQYVPNISPGRYILAGDIGGTNSTFAFLREKKDQRKKRERKNRQKSQRNKKALQLLCSLHFSSRDITNFPAVVQQVLGYAKQQWGIRAAYSCFAGAGPVSENRDHCTLTHLPWNIDGKALKRAAKLNAVIINDFEAVAYGIEELRKGDFLLLKKGINKKRKALKLPKAILGAGTGLGKSLLVWNEKLHRHMPLPSEGGHADLAVLHDEELGFIHFMKKREKGNVAWEDAVSGKGITALYLYLEETRYYEASPQSMKIKLDIEKSCYSPEVIAGYASRDAQCREAILLFLRFYARSAKNVALETLPFGGLYIAGGIAAKNQQLFKRKEFIEEFLASKRQRQLLKKIPLYLVKNYNISLYGAGRAALL